jgi:transposase
MLAESEDKEQIIARVAAVDIGKAEVVCCVRLPAAQGADNAGRRCRHIRR